MKKFLAIMLLTTVCTYSSDSLSTLSNLTKTKKHKATRVAKIEQILNTRSLDPNTRKRLETSLNKAQKDLKETNSMISTYLEMVEATNDEKQVMAKR